MRILIIIFILLQTTFLFGQDGSDINYVKPEKLDKSYVGRIIQIDFYRRSFDIKRGGERKVDKVLLDIEGRQVEFIEHREDDGFNNWFSQQYLESSDKKIRIKEFKLLEIEKETIRVSAYFTIKPFTKDFNFRKSDIAEILIKAIDKD